MYWTDLPCNELMKRVFSKAPKVGAIDLFDIEIKRDGPTVIINFDMVDNLPDTPPVKWGGFNRCRIGLYCFDVSDIAISGISRNMLAKISFVLESGNNKVMISGDNFKISLVCSHINLTGPSVYFSQ